MGYMLSLRCFELREKCLCQFDCFSLRPQMRNQCTLLLKMSLAFADMPLDHFQLSLTVIHVQNGTSFLGN